MEAKSYKGTEEFTCPICGCEDMSGPNGMMEKDNSLLLVYECYNCGGAVGKTYAKRVGTYPGTFDLIYHSSNGIIGEDK